MLLARASLEVVLTSFHLLLSYATWLCVFGFLCLRFGFWIFYCTLFIYLDMRTTDLYCLTALSGLSVFLRYAI